MLVSSLSTRSRSFSCPRINHLLVSFLPISRCSFWHISSRHRLSQKYLALSFAISINRDSFWGQVRKVTVDPVSYPHGIYTKWLSEQRRICEFREMRAKKEGTDLIPRARKKPARFTTLSQKETRGLWLPSMRFGGLFSRDTCYLFLKMVWMCGRRGGFLWFPLDLPFANICADIRQNVLPLVSRRSLLFFFLQKWSKPYQLGLWGLFIRCLSLSVFASFTYAKKTAS